MLFTLLFPFFRTPQTASDCVSYNHPPETPPGQWAFKDSLKSDQLFHILLAIEAHYLLETVLDPILWLSPIGPKLFCIRYRRMVTKAVYKGCLNDIYRLMESPEWVSATGVFFVVYFRNIYAYYCI